MNKILVITKLSLLGCFFAVMVGCGSTVQGVNGDQGAVTENPYLLNRQKVSGEALTRFEKANEAMEKKQWQEAEKQLSWLVENYPRLSGPYLDLALFYRQTGQQGLREPRCYNLC